MKASGGLAIDDIISGLAAAISAESRGALTGGNAKMATKARNKAGVLSRNEGGTDYLKINRLLAVLVFLRVLRAFVVVF
jgi:hypothetical protein